MSRALVNCSLQQPKHKTHLCGEGISCKSNLQCVVYMSGTGCRKPKEGYEANADWHQEQEFPNYWSTPIAKWFGKLWKACAFLSRARNTTKWTETRSKMFGLFGNDLHWLCADGFIFETVNFSYVNKFASTSLK